MAGGSRSDADLWSVAEAMEFAASGVEGFLFGLGDARIDEWTAVVIDQVDDELVDGKLH